VAPCNDLSRPGGPHDDDPTVGTLSAPHFVSIDEAARRLGVARSTVYAQYLGRELHRVKQGRRSMVAVVEVNALARRLAADAGVELELVTEHAEAP
jgi:hypothetical protein